MNLQKTIAELEEQAAQYTEAANTLRALLNQTDVAIEEVVEATPAVPAKSASKKSAPRKAAASKTAAKGSQNKQGDKQRKKRAPVSPETRAKIAAAIKARHAERKAQAA